MHVLDRRTSLVTHRATHEWLPRQAAPALDNQLIGLPAGKGQRTLQLANPGDDVARAEVKIITGDTSFAPEGLQPITIRAGSTTQVSLTKVLAKALGDGAVGVQVTADAPILASLLSELGTDQAVTVPGEVIRSEAATLLPVASAKGRRRSPPRSTSQRPPRARRRSRRTTPTASSSCTSASASRRATPWRSSCPGARRT